LSIFMCDVLKEANIHDSLNWREETLYK
jgi:hypothetical protein